MVPLSSNIHQSNQLCLPAKVSDFIPRARWNMPTISEERMSLASHSRTSSIKVPRLNQPIYDNRVSGVPTHWIPIYGAGQGMFYDPVSTLFYGDEAPRPTLERLDGTMQLMDNEKPAPPFSFQPEDVLRLQPPSMIEPVTREVEHDPDMVRKFYCRCEDAWLEQPHECPVKWEEEELSVDEALPVAIWPGNGTPLGPITHELVIEDLSYLTPWQRYAYEQRMSMLMPSVTGMGAIR